MAERSVNSTSASELAETVERLRGELEAAQQRYEQELDSRRRVERELQESEAVYHSLVENLPVSLIRKDMEGRLVFANRPVCEEYGQSLDELIGKTDFDFFPDELARKYRADDRRVIESREVFEDIEAHRTPEGQWQYAHIIKAPVIDSHGDVVGVQGVFWDETDRKRAEEELKTSEARKRAIFETSLNSLIISDESGRIVEFNRAAEQTFGYSREEAMGQNMDELLFDPSRQGKDEQSFLRFSAIGEDGSLMGKRLEVPLVRRDGEEFIAEIAMRPIPLEGTVHFATVLHDITNRKKNQAALQKAKEDAEAASRAKSAFLANMSHEIRTPMNAILGMTGLVLDTALSSEQREHLLIVQDSTESLLSLINDILDFSKIEAGRLDLHPAPFALRDRVGDTMKSLSIRAHDKKLELACHIAPDVPEFVIADVGRLRQVIINLVGNAIKFTDRGEVVLDVSVESRTDEEAQLHFSVRDTGIGIPANRLDGIFEAFEQVDSSTTRRFGGTGLGLAVSTRLVALMGGRISVDSEVGTGSTFHVSVRFEIAPQQSPTTQELALESLRGLSVLAVDDNGTNLLILQEMLANWEMSVAIAGNAQEGLRLLRDSRADGDGFQLLLTDSHMPDADGFWLIEQIRNDAQLCDMTIMMLTSGDQSGDYDRCQELKVSRYMTKPVKQSELLDAIGASFDISELMRRHGAAEGDDARHLRGLKILLAEDSIPNQKLALGLLRKQDHEIVVAADGVAALGQWKSEHFDLILMDVQMPHMDGLEATRLIRKREEATNRHIPIVAMTAHAMHGDEERCLAAGMDAYVAKPIRPEDLFTAIDDVGPKVILNRPTPLPSTRQSASSSAAINWTAALEVVQQDEELLTEVVDAVLEEVPQLTSELRRAVAERDAPTVQRMAHTIKGNMRTFQADRGMAVAEQLEQRSRDGNLQDAQSLCDQLCDEADAFLVQLRDSPYTSATEPHTTD